MATAEKIRQEIEGMRFAQFVNGLDSVKAEMQRAWAVFEMRQADEQLVTIQSSRNRITTLF